MYNTPGFISFLAFLSHIVVFASDSIVIKLRGRGWLWLRLILHALAIKPDRQAGQCPVPQRQVVFRYARQKLQIMLWRKPGPSPIDKQVDVPRRSIFIFDDRSNDVAFGRVRWERGSCGATKTSEDFWADDLVFFWLTACMRRFSRDPFLARVTHDNTCTPLGFAVDYYCFCRQDFLSNENMSRMLGFCFDLNASETEKRTSEMKMSIEC